MKGTRFKIIDALFLFKFTLVLNADPSLWNCLPQVPAPYIRDLLCSMSAQVKFVFLPEAFKPLMLFVAVLIYFAPNFFLLIAFYIGIFLIITMLCSTRIYCYVLPKKPAYSEVRCWAKAS
jgi:hypothetical protein